MESNEIANIVQQLCDSYELEIYELHSTIHRIMNILDEAAIKGPTIEIMEVWKAMNEII